MEINSITQSAQEDKLANMANAFKEGGARAKTMDCLLQQVLTAGGQSRVGPSTLQSLNHCDTWWLSSAVEYLQEVGLTLSTNPTGTEFSKCQLRQAYPMLTADDLDLLYLHNITTVAELVMVDDGPCPLFGHMIQEHDIAPWPQEQIQVLPGQIWLMTDGSPLGDRLVEVFRHST